MNDNSSAPLVFAHIGDLHITKAKEQNYIDYLSILAQLQSECRDQLDFVFLPGDIADNGLPEQYNQVMAGLRMLSVPAHIIAGDHDMEQGSLNNFYSYLPAEKLPKSFLLKGVKCIFLDVCGQGKGGPDFRLGDEQLTWLINEVGQTSARIILFMHTYPADLVDHNEKDVLNRIIAANNILLVDMGHTHYNDIANDGHALFTATRSTGQIEEGPVGYSLITIDGETVSWRFKPLADPFPFVMITTPADRRLRRDNADRQKNSISVSAIIFGYNLVDKVACKLPQVNLVPMAYSENQNVWSANIEVDEKACTEIMVEAFDQTGRPGRHHIEYFPVHPNSKTRVKKGSDADAIEAWPENGVFGTQLGPNRNGKPSS